ncbi:hypothetical protein G6F59_018177 [Rhizopus arrhizus]|nr:hypothetical protein G6F59_018177 [Rhizopus arrhizus]
MHGLSEAAGRDWAWWYGRETFWLTLKTYSPEDAAAGVCLEADMALCVDGAGAVQSEHKAIDDSLKDDDADGMRPRASCRNRSRASAR